MAIQAPIDTMRRSPWEIAQMYLARRGQFRERNLGYGKLLSYYFGKSKSGANVAHDIQSMDARGKSILRDLGVSLSMDRRYIANRMMPIVEDYQALVGSMPIIRVESASSEDGDERQAEKETRYLYSTYGPRMSNMDWHHAYAGFCLSCMGDAIYVPEIDAKTGRVMVSAEMPLNAYPSWWAPQGARRWELYDLILAEVWEREDIRRQYAYDTGSDAPNDNLVVTYLSPYQRTTILAQRVQGGLRARDVLADVDWDLGFCPAVWVRNKMNGQYASSDIAPVLGLQDYYDFLLNVMADGVVEMTYPMRMVRNPVDTENGPLMYGPGATVEVGPEGDLKAITPTPVPQAAMMLMHQALEDMNVGSGTSSIRQEGLPDRSNISGRAIQTSQGPQATRVDLKQVILGAGLAQLNYHVLAMQEKAPLTPSKFDIFGSVRGQVFKEEFTPKNDINGWYENTVRWDQMVGVNQQQRLMYAVEGKQNQIFDDLTAMEMAGIQNPMEMRKKVEASVIHQAELQSKANQAVQGGPEPGALALGPAGVNSPKGGAAPPTVGAPAAGGEQPKIPPMVFQPPNRGAGAGPGGLPGPSLGPPPLPHGVPVGVSLEKVRQAIAPIADQLKGGVYAVGDLATAGAAPRVTLRITDQADYRIVKQAVMPLDPKPEIRYVSEANLPPEAERVDFTSGHQQAPGGLPPGGPLAALAAAAAAGGQGPAGAPGPPG